MTSRDTTPGRLTLASVATHTQVNDVPFGLIAYTTVDGHSGTLPTTPTVATLTGFDTGTVTTLSNRYYRIYFELSVMSDSIDTIRLYLTDGSNSVLASCDVSIPNGDTNVQIGRSFIHAPGAGGRNYKVRGSRLTSLGVCISSCDSTIPGYITVEDVGPSTGWA